MASLDGFSRFKGEATCMDGSHGRAEAEGLRGEGGGELVGNGLHSAMGKGGRPLAEHFEDEFKHAAAGREGILKKDSAEEGLKKSLPHGLTEAETFEGLTGRYFGSGLNALNGGKGEPCLEGADTHFVGKGTRRGAEGARKLARMPERINKAVEGFTVPDKGSGKKASEAKALVIEEATTFGIGVEEDLEAPVETVSLHALGAHPAARLVSGFEKAALAAAAGKGPGTGETGQAGADKGHIKDCFFHVTQTVLPRRQ